MISWKCEIDDGLRNNVFARSQNKIDNENKNNFLANYLVVLSYLEEWTMKTKTKKKTLNKTVNKNFQMTFTICSQNRENVENFRAHENIKFCHKTRHLLSVHRCFENGNILRFHYVLYEWLMPVQCEHTIHQSYTLWSFSRI
jgi:hypothetical protein